MSGLSQLGTLAGMIYYEGKRTRSGVMVSRHERPDASNGDSLDVSAATLPMRLDLADHSPSGFQWGYGGSGPAQLALALLVDVLDDEDLALTLYQAYKEEVIARLPEKDWRLTEDEILAAASRLTAETSKTWLEE